MAELTGYAGKLLFVDLSNGTLEIEDLPIELARNFVSGAAMGAKILYERMPAHTDPFAPESMIGFLPGVLNGTGALYGGRYSVVSKSPVTGMWNDCNSGGFFGQDLKQAGFDGVFFKGIAEKPVYLWVEDGKAELRDASAYWGLRVTEAENAIKDDIGDEKITIAMIGPGGENLSYLSGIVNDGHRIAARGGSGAVMGSKKLKAVVVKQNRAKQIPVADKEMIKKLNADILAFMKGPFKDMTASFGSVGTAGLYEPMSLSNDAGIKNWTGIGGIDWEEAVAHSMDTNAMDVEHKTGRYGCSACPMRCGAFYKSDDKRYPLKHAGRPEYESVGAFSGMTLVKDVTAMLKSNDLCNEGGLDAISTGATVAWAMECYENGLFTQEEVDGLELNWGNAEAQVALVEKIVNGEGCGKVFGLGTMNAAKALGKGEEYLVVAGGMEPPQHDSRLAPGLARTYQYDPTPGRHVKGTSMVGGAAMPPEVKYNYEGTGYDDLLNVIGMELDNSCGWCYFGRLFGMINDPNQPMYLAAVTGFPFNRLETYALGQRMYTIRHAFNLREGLTREACTISPRLIHGNTEGNGLFEGIDVDNEKLMDNFLDTIGWTRDFVPTKSFLEIIGGLDDVIRDLYGDA